MREALPEREIRTLVSKSVLAGGLLVLGSLQAGCATSVQAPAPDPDATRAESCDTVLAAWESHVVAAGVGDAQWTAVPGHPGLRVERFLACD